MKSPPKTLTNLDASILVESLKCNAGTPKQYRRGIRNYTMALIMLDAGLRVGELVKLKTTDLLYNGQPVNTIVVRPDIAKSKRERCVPTGVRLKNAITEIARDVWPTEATNLQLYAIYQLYSDKPMTTRQVERIIRKASLDALGRPVHPHILRHTFATRLMRVTNTTVVQMLLGHRSLKSTQVYCHPNAEDLKDAINQVERRDYPDTPREIDPPSPGDLSNSLDTVNADRDVT